MKKMHILIDKELKKCKNKDDKEIQAAIIEGYNQLEKEWIEIAQKSFHGGFPKAAYVGSCALVSIIHDNKLYVANAGDSKAALLRKTKDGYKRVKVSKTFNANKKYEQERLKAEHPGE